MSDSTRPPEIPGAGNLRRIAELLCAGGSSWHHQADLATNSGDAAEPLKERRHALRLQAQRPRAVRHPIPLLPDNCVVITNNAAVVDGQYLAPNVRVFDANAIAQDLLAEYLEALRPRHLRVLVDLPPANLAGGLTPAMKDVLELHTATFLAARTCAAWLAEEGSLTVVLLGGVATGAVPHPLTGLFTGLVKSLELELDKATVMAVVHQGRTLAAVAGDVQDESGAERAAATAYYCDDQRFVPVAAPAPARVNDLPLARDSVVVAAGGGRGIGAEMLKAIAARIRCRIFVLGTNPLTGASHGLRSTDATAADQRRREFIRERIGGAGPVSVVQARAEFDQLLGSEAIRATLGELSDRCGSDRVEYITCDLREQSDVDNAVRHILDAVGSVDLLLNLAGLHHAQSLARKSVDDFVLVRDTKVRCYLNLKAAFGRSQPKRWFNCGSVIGFLGQLGETDYASANDFLYSVGAYAAANGAAESTVGFGPWGEAGFASTPHQRANLEHQGIDLISTGEGVQHFLAELSQQPVTPNTVLLSTNDHAPTGPIRAKFVSGLIDGAPRVEPRHQYVRPPAPTLPFYVDQIIEQTADTITVVRELTTLRDDYLQQHQVRGNPTLPGAFVTEIAAEVACLLVPNLMVAGFDALSLEKFIQIPDGRSSKKTITAKLTNRGEGHATVDVRIHGDIISPDGHVLHRDRRYASVSVRLARQIPAPPTWPHWPDDPRSATIGGLSAGGGPLELTGVFASVHEMRRATLGCLARFKLDDAEDNDWLDSFMVAPVLLDGAVQVGLSALPEEHRGAVAVPYRIDKISLYDHRNDIVLHHHEEHITLYAQPALVESRTGKVIVGEVAAVTEDGHVIASLTGLVGVILHRPEMNNTPVALEGHVTHEKHDSAVKHNDPASQFPEVVELSGRLDRMRQVDDWDLYYVVHEPTPDGGTVAEGVEQTSFSGYNYLGLSGEPSVNAAAKAAIDVYGTSCSASRLVGERPLHQTLEAELADFLGTEEALVLAGGYLMCMSMIDGVVGAEDLVVYDTFAHVSIKQGSTLSGATVRSFPHNDHHALDRFLGRFRNKYRRALLVIEGIYGMDGDLPNLPAFVEVARRHDTLIMIDEAHSIGVLGRTGRGIGEHFGVDRRDVDLWTATLSKSFGSFGGYVAGTKTLINYLRYSASGFLFCAGLPPADTAATLAALRCMRAQPERLDRLRGNTSLFRRLAEQAGIDTARSHHEAPIVPCMIRDESAVIKLTHALQRRGFLANPVVYPGVLRGEERLRFFITVNQAESEIRDAVRVLAEEMRGLCLLGESDS